MWNLFFKRNFIQEFLRNTYCLVIKRPLMIKQQNNLQNLFKQLYNYSVALYTNIHQKSTIHLINLYSKKRKNYLTVTEIAIVFASSTSTTAIWFSLTRYNDLVNPTMATGIKLLNCLIKQLLDINAGQSHNSTFQIHE